MLVFFGRSIRAFARLIASEDRVGAAAMRWHRAVKG
jgi:hypothetical protein